MGDAAAVSLCVAAVRRRRSSKNATTPITNSAANVPPTAPAITAVSAPVDDDDAGAETDWLAVVVLVMVDGVVVLVGVEAGDVPSIVVVLSAVVGGRLLHEHRAGTVEQFCKWLSGRQNKIQNLTMNVCERSLCKCGQERKH